MSIVDEGKKLFSSFFSDTKQAIETALPQRDCKLCQYSEFQGITCKLVDPPRRLASTKEAQLCVKYTPVSLMSDEATVAAVQEVEDKTDVVASAVSLVKTSVDSLKGSSSKTFSDVQSKLSDVETGITANYEKLLDVEAAVKKTYPNSPTNRREVVLTCQPYSYAWDELQLGAGEVVVALWYVLDADTASSIIPYLRGDGNDLLPVAATLLTWLNLFGQNANGLSVLTSSNLTTLFCTIPYRFATSAVIGAYNGSSTVRTVRASLTLFKN